MAAMNDRETVFAAIVVMILVTAASQCPMPAGAQNASTRRIPDQTVLARVGASECGLAHCTAGELSAIREVLLERCTGCSLETAARRYSDSVFDHSRTDSRAWVVDLRADGSQPRGWPSEVVRNGVLGEHAPWAAFRDRWMALYALAGRVIDEELPSGCDGRVAHWGQEREGTEDYERAIRNGWTRIDCPDDFRNAFWWPPNRPQR